MKIIVIHNYYQQPGGEDQVFAAESSMLKEHGHRVFRYTVHNDSIEGMNPLTLARSTLWNKAIARELRETIRKVRPDVVHFHNTFPLISPAAYYVARAEGIPVVQSLHNPRLLCPGASFYRNGRVCTDCHGKTLPWPGIVHACYRKSHTETAVVTALVTFHRWIKTWEKMIDIYVVFTEFYRRKFIEGGLPSEKIVIKPHFISPDPCLRTESDEGYALFIGRLDPEKGVRTLLHAWQFLKNIPLKIRGDGQLLSEIQNIIITKQLNLVEIVGRLSREDLCSLIKGARFLVWPSEGYYENFGLVAVESFACGVPVIASRIGVLKEIVDDGRTGLFFEPGNAKDLANKVQWLFEHPKKAEEMGRNARAEYKAKYTPERNYEMLMHIYEKAISCSH